MNEETCEVFVREESTYDYVIRLEPEGQNETVLEQFPCRQVLGNQAIVVYEDTPYSLARTRYSEIPKCYGLMNVESLVESGVYQMQNYPGLMLQGTGVMIGFVDTGIDYENWAFRNENGTTRIHSIWDQTQSSGAPDGFLYGREYSREQIDEALRSLSPRTMVPTYDEDGHGTALAAIAAGSQDLEHQFSGAAPEADILVVKLKKAKNHLREFWSVSGQSAAYAESDIMNAIWYLHRKALAELRPLVICIGLGTNQGDHAGGGPLGNLVAYLNQLRWRAVVAAVGDEGNERHHFFGRVEETEEYKEVELRIGEGADGLSLEVWGTPPNVYSLALISPSGEQIPRVAAVPGVENAYTLLFDQTKIRINYQLAEGINGNSLAVLRFQQAAAGIWRIRVYPSQEFHRTFHMWLPITQFLNGETYFLEPDPYMTLTEPAATPQAISVGAYDGNTGNLAVFSGRGFNGNAQVKPDLVAPGVDVETVLLGSNEMGNTRYGPQSGTSMATALTAGAAALLLEWAAVRNFLPSVTGISIQSFLIRGARRPENRSYPNREWGYGMLDLYGAFEELVIR